MTVYDQRFMKNLKNDQRIKDNEPLMREILQMETYGYKIELQNVFTPSKIQDLFHYFAKLMLTKKAILLTKEECSVQSFHEI